MTIYEFTAGGERYGIRPANDLESRRAAYRLLYDIYSTQGYGESSPSRMWFSLYDMLPSTLTLTVLLGEEEVGAVTLVGDSALGLPVDGTYGEDMARERAAGVRPTEVMSLGVRPDLRGSRAIIATLMNFVWFTALHVQNSTHLVITIVPHHAAFYEDQWGFVRKGAIGFHEKTGVHCTLLTLDLEMCEKRTEDPAGRRVVSRYRIPRDRKREVAESLSLAARPITEAEAAYFLREVRPDIWRQATPRQRRHLSDALGLDWEREGLPFPAARSAGRRPARRVSVPAARRRRVQPTSA